MARRYRSISEDDAAQLFLDSMESYRGKYTVDVVDRYLTRDTTLPQQPLTDFTNELLDIKQDVVNRYGKAAAERLARVTGEPVVWNMESPRISYYVNTSSALRIDWVNRSTMQAIQQVLTEAELAGANPRTALVSAKKVVGLDPRLAGAVERMRQSMLADGMSVASANRAANQYADRLLDHRANRIGRNEVMEAINFAEREAWDQAAEARSLDPNLMEVTWVTHGDERTCPTCGPMDGVTVKRSDHFYTGEGPVKGPPLHIGCRCRLALVVDSVSKAMDSPSVEWPDWSTLDKGDVVEKAKHSWGSPGEGVMVAWFPPQDVIDQLREFTGFDEPDSEIHMTLGYFGKAADMTSDQRQRLLSAVLSVSSQSDPASGEVSGVARFSGDGEDPFVALVDVGELPALHQAFVEAVTGEGLPLFKNHGYTAHITLKYLDPADDTPQGRMERIPVVIDSLTVVIGDERYDYPFQPS